MASQNTSTIVPNEDSGIAYTPTSAWGYNIAPDATGGGAHFDDGFTNAQISYTFSQPATGFEYWGYQRSDYGVYSICFDCPSTFTGGARINGVNASTNGTEPPRLLYSAYNLTYASHNVSIVNVFDTRTVGTSTAGGFGQMNLDRFVLISPNTPPTTSSSVPSSTSTAAASGAPNPPSGATAVGGTSSHSNAGAIAGGVVGGLAALAIVLVLLWFFWWRNRRQGVSRQDMNGGEHAYEPKPTSFDHPSPVTPFILSSPQQVPMQDMYPPQVANPSMTPMTTPGFAGAGSSSGPSQAGSSEYNGGPRPLPTRSGSGHTTTTTATVRPVKGARQMSADPVVRSEAATSPSLYPTSSDYSGPTATSQPFSPPRRERDAGFLQGDDLVEEEPETLPPDYHAATANPRHPGQT